MHFEIKINMLLKADFSLLDLKFKYMCVLHCEWIFSMYMRECVKV